MEPKRYIAKNGDLYCPHCGGCVEVDLINGDCPLCGKPITNKIAPVGLDCHRKDCQYCDFMTGCNAPEFCKDRLLIEEP